MGTQAAAQTVTLEPPQLRQTVDEQGVDLASGELVMPSSSVSIGGERGLAHSRYRVSNGWRHNFILSISDGSDDLGATLRVQIGGTLREFLIDDTDFIPLNGENGTLVSNAGAISTPMRQVPSTSLTLRRCLTAKAIMKLFKP